MRLKRERAKSRKMRTGILSSSSPWRNLSPQTRPIPSPQPPTPNPHPGLAQWAQRWYPSRWQQGLRVSSYGSFVNFLFPLLALNKSNHQSTKDAP